MSFTAAGALAACLPLSSCSRSTATAPIAPNTSAPSSAAPTATPAAESAPAPSTAENTAQLNSQLFRKASPGGPPSELPLGPGDLIEVSVVDVPELSGRKVRVPRTGGVTLPLLGEVPVAGRSGLEVEEDLRRRLSKTYMHDPQVSLFVHERQSQRVSVLGAVKKGGVVELTGRVRLADALAMAEGLADDADHVVHLFRRAPIQAVAKVQTGSDAAASGNEAKGTADVMTTIDLEAIANGNEELNVPLEAGDVIQVPRAGSFYVGGQVGKPGSFVLKGKTGVHQAILAAGGATSIAALGDVRLYRAKSDGQIAVTPLDLEDFEAGKGSPDVQRNDVIVVGKSGTKAFFYGAYDFFRGVFGMSKGF